MRPKCELCHKTMREDIMTVSRRFRHIGKKSYDIVIGHRCQNHRCAGFRKLIRGENKLKAKKVKKLEYELINFNIEKE